MTPRSSGPRLNRSLPVPRERGSADRQLCVHCRDNKTRPRSSVNAHTKVVRPGRGPTARQAAASEHFVRKIQSQLCFLFLNNSKLIICKNSTKITRPLTLPMVPCDVITAPSAKRNSPGGFMRPPCLLSDVLAAPRSETALNLVSRAQRRPQAATRCCDPTAPRVLHDGLIAVLVGRTGKVLCGRFLSISLRVLWSPAPGRVLCWVSPRYGYWFFPCNQ